MTNLHAGGRIEVSVVVCTRNRAAILPRALETLAAQVTGRAFEVVVVDNASEDETPDVIAEWCQRDARFRGVAEPQLGLSRAKNAGVANARGEILLFTDDDVLVEPEWVEAHVSLLAGRRDLVISGGTVMPIPSDLSPWPDWLGEATLVDLPMLDHGPPPRPLARWEQVWGANMAIPRDVFARVGAWNEDLGRKGDERGTWEDLDFAERVRRAGGEVWCCPAAVIRHRIPAERLRPRPILRAAFRRGLDDYVKGAWARGETYPPAPPLARRIWAFITLVAHLARWAALALTFRFVRRRAVFDIARGAAWSAGKRMVELTMRRSAADPSDANQSLFDDGSAGARAITWLCFLVRRVALRSAPSA